MTKLTRMFATALGLALAGGAAAQAASFADIQSSGTLRVGTPGDYAPFSVARADGGYKGADVVEIGRVAKALGLQIAWVRTSWKDLAADTKADRFDIAVGGITITDARKEFAAFTVPLVTDGKRPIVRCADKDKYVTLAAIDKPDVHVVVNVGGTNDAFAKANLSHSDLTHFDDNTKIFDQIVSGKEDVMVTDGVEVDHQALLHPGVLCAAEVKAPFTHSQKGYMMQKDPALKAAVDKVLSADIKSGAWQKTLTEAEKQP
ncbi:transporter substrate-binding domain-containing protein [Acidimangrovimonas sediminis]|uniref:transporter substrate-binding domain-containing protein n=1 Tax=Acidimangrovimonas sediminis TaxID=2056283 RepID=UPI0018EC5399|nr:transporter substrate-binding domain-containing protein [Acidimangrovimonas sediminis]